MTVNSDDALIEAMARAVYEGEGGTAWPSLEEGNKNDYRRGAATALAAARPVIRAQALEDAAKECDKLGSDPRMYTSERRRGAGQYAAAIRALKEKSST